MTYFNIWHHIFIKDLNIIKTDNSDIRKTFSGKSCHNGQIITRIFWPNFDPTKL